MDQIGLNILKRIEWTKWTELDGMDQSRPKMTKLTEVDQKLIFFSFLKKMSMLSVKYK